MFSIAAIALVAMAATLGVTFVVHDRTAQSVADSREASRAAMRQALSEWNTPTAPGAGQRGSSQVGGNEQLEELKRRIDKLAEAEDARYERSQQAERNIRIVAMAGIFAALVLVLIMINGRRKRLISQASDVIRHNESLESRTEGLQKQTEALEISNGELALAIQETEQARLHAEEQIAAQTVLFNAITDDFFVIDREGRYHAISPTNDATLSASRGKLIGARVHEVLPQPVAALALSATSKALDNRERVDVEYPLEIDGQSVWFSGNVTPLADDKVLWVVRDVSETRKAAEALKESEARFRNLVEHSPQAVALHSEGRLLYANPACATMLGFTDPAQLLGRPLLRFVTRETLPKLKDCLASLGRTPSRAVTCEVQFRRDGDTRLLAVEVTSVPMRYNGRAGVLSILHDVTERKQLEEQLAHQAFHDPLTNLANRVLFRDRVEHAIQRCAGGSGSPAVLFLDLDNFKAVNDSLGHSAGDWLLIEVATRLSACLRPADTVARLGGDEFAVLIDCGTSSSAELADVILNAFREPFSVHGNDILMSLSIGIADVAPLEGADDVLRNADLALYRAKGDGKACAASFKPEMHVAARRRLEMENELRRAIYGDTDAGELVLYYQPLAMLSSGRMAGYEALVRWVHPARGILEPLDFIPLAEDTGLIVPLGRWVLHEACRQTAEWQAMFARAVEAKSLSLAVGVNLSGRHLSQPELLDDVSSAISLSGIQPNDLVLELTESMLVHDNRVTLERLHALKSIGVRLSIDDFGTGYSSLAYLQRFPVDSLKMDRSFVAGLGRESANSPLAEAVIGLGRTLGLRVVAEGIETAEQWDRLRVMGCAVGQGFYISRPVQAPAFERLIKRELKGGKGLADGRFSVSTQDNRRRPVSTLQATA